MYKINQKFLLADGKRSTVICCTIFLIITYFLPYCLLLQMPFKQISATNKLKFVSKPLLVLRNSFFLMEKSYPAEVI